MSSQWNINSRGYLGLANLIESPNQDERPDGTIIELLVIHCISLPPGEFGGGHIDKFFSNELDPTKHQYFKKISDLRVSAHFLIDRKGQVTQYVSCLKRAWHAGRSLWKEKENCNDFSIGIELEGIDNKIFTDIQYSNLAMLTRGLMRKYGPVDLAAHSEVAIPAGRKNDPGDLFLWDKYRNLLRS